MGLTDQYRHLDDLPASIPVFPLPQALLLPRTQLPLNIFEPRYLKMVEDAMAGARIMGMVQPAAEAGKEPVPNAPAGQPAIAPIGCAGRITSYAETGDGRVLITLTGIARFQVSAELQTMTPYRQCAVDWTPFEHDLQPGIGADEVARDRLLDILRRYLDTHDLQADWRAIKFSGNETLVNSLACISPFGAKEKQALLEAKTLEERNQILIAMTEIALADEGDQDRPLQ